MATKKSVDLYFRVITLYNPFCVFLFQLLVA